MNRIRLLTGTLLASAILAGCGMPSSMAPMGANSPAVSKNDFRGNGTSRREIVVKLTPGIGAKSLGIKVKRTIPSINTMVVEVPDGKTPEQVMADLQKTGRVMYVDYVNQVILEEEAVDPMMKDQYALTNTKATTAWKTTKGDANTIVAVIDTGADLNHPDLKDKIVKSYNVFTKNADVKDSHGHGTHCAGIAAAALNGVGIAGIAPDAGLMPVQVLNAGGGGSDATIAEGIVWAADNGADVMTMSLGLYKRSKVIEEALQYALDKNISLVASAGNNNALNDPEKAPHLPSTYPGVIEVAATDAMNAKARFSNFGKTVSVAAPGVDILSTVPGNYKKMSGTSMASPAAAGVVALIRSKYPNLSQAQVKAHLEKTAQDLGTAGFDEIYGHGLVDAAAAVK
jgi:subtilisin family serine protease